MDSNRSGPLDACVGIDDLCRKIPIHFCENLPGENPMVSKIPVVPENKAVREAYNRGYNRFENYETNSDAEEMAPISHFQESAEWANTVLPTLRALSGYEDQGNGTYTGRRDVAVIHEQDFDDLPIDGERMGADELLSSLVSIWQTGAYHATSGEERNPPEL